jgi:hypothetical protein
MAAPGNFNLARAVREWCFVQLPLFDLGKLRNEAKRRGLDDFAPCAERVPDRER